MELTQKLTSIRVFNSRKYSSIVVIKELISPIQVRNSYISEPDFKFVSCKTVALIINNQYIEFNIAATKQ
jgi:hypothetical protein